MLGEFDVELVFRAENLHILRDVGRKVLDGPRTQDGVLVGRGLVGVVSRRQDEARLGLGHPRPDQVAVL